MEQKYYVYVYLDTRKNGLFQYENLTFEHEPFYVGKGKGSRDKEHLAEYSLKHSSNPYKNRKIKKILAEGSEPLIIRLHNDLSDDDAIRLEIETIRAIGRLNLRRGPLVNLTDGGEGTSGRITSYATKELMSKQRTGKKQSPAQYTANCNRTHSEATIAKMSQCQKGIRRLTDEQYSEIAEKNRGKKRSPETIKLLSDMRRGKRQTPAQLAANRARILNFTWITYDEFKQFAQKLPPEFHHARRFLAYLREHNPPNIPKDPRTAYGKRGEWISWNDVFGR